MNTHKLWSVNKMGQSLNRGLQNDTAQDFSKTSKDQKFFPKYSFFHLTCQIQSMICACKLRGPENLI